MSKILIEVSSRHVHLSSKDLEKLFGKGYKLKKLASLSQPGEFAAKETIDVKTDKGVLKNVRIIGPTRPETQVEVSVTDTFSLGVKYVFRNSGDLKRSPGAVLVGNRGKVKIKKGVICVIRHIHMNASDAGRLKVRNGKIVAVKVGGKRGLVFENVLVRVSDKYSLAMHIDTDEGNSAGINKETFGNLL